MRDSILQRFAVPFEYPVVFTEDVFEPSNPTLEDVLRRLEPARRQRALFVLDDGLAAASPLLSDRIAAYCEARPERMAIAGTIVLPGGEAAKNDAAAVEGLQRRFREAGLDRQSFVVIAGGGAFLDMAGYAAATAHRGIRAVRLPTTVLAQNDSGIGVKNGVNAFGAKNYLGTFAPPFAVINDATFLETLPARDRIAGIAEAVKVALIRDEEFFRWLESRAGPLAKLEAEASRGMIRRAAELHLRHIAESGDPFESGSARPLDFGHWAAHALEVATGFRLRHGEAVSIGVALDTRYSVDAGLLPEADGERVITLLERIGLPVWDDSLGAEAAGGGLAILGGLQEFREHLGGTLTIPLLAAVGKSTDVGSISADRVCRCVDALRARRRGVR